MKNSTKLKLILDSAMVVLLMLMYKKQVISMIFHEIGGLIFLGFVLIHVFIINRKWVISVTKKVFSKSTGTRLRVMALDDFLLLVDFIFFGVAAVLISHVVFSFNVQGMTFKAMHYFCASCALILIGIHLGLHRKMYAKVSIPKAAGIIISLALVAFGIYAMCTTSFFRWLAMPFSSSASGTGEGMQMMQNAGAAAQGAGSMMHGAEAGFSFPGLLLVLLEFFSIAYVFTAATALVDRLCSRKKI